VVRSTVIGNRVPHADRRNPKSLSIALLSRHILLLYPCPRSSRPRSVIAEIQYEIILIVIFYDNRRHTLYYYYYYRFLRICYWYLEWNWNDNRCRRSIYIIIYTIIVKLPKYQQYTYSLIVCLLLIICSWHVLKFMKITKICNFFQWKIFHNILNFISHGLKFNTMIPTIYSYSNPWFKYTRLSHIAFIVIKRK